MRNFNLMQDIPILKAKIKLTKFFDVNMLTRDQWTEDDEPSSDIYSSWMAHGLYYRSRNGQKRQR